MNEEPNINKLATVSLALSLLGFGSIGYLASYFVGIIDLPGIYTLSVGETLA